MPKSSGTKMADAFPEFVRDVEFAVGVDSAEYAEFTQLIGAFQIRRTGVVHLRSRMEEILKDHPILLDQFKRLSQQGYDNPPTQSARFKQAIKFLIRVKTRFSDNQSYATFLGLITSYKAGTIDFVQMYREMGELFRENWDLMEEFTAFLPSTGSSN